MTDLKQPRWRDALLYPVGKPAREVEDILNDMFDGHNHVIAAEAFDGDGARQDKELDTVIGPWVVGPPDAVYSLLEHNGWEDFSVQYELGQEVQQ